MSFPSPLAAAASVIAALLGVAITYLLSRVLRLRATTISLGNARQQTRFVVLLSFVEFATIAIFRYFKGPGQASPLGVSFDAIDVLIQLVRSGVVVLLPLAIIVWLTRQSTISLGIRKEETSKMIALGVAPSTGFFFLFVLVAPLVGGGFASLTASSVAYGFIIFVLVGFSEELVWRLCPDAAYCPDNEGVWLDCRVPSLLAMASSNKLSCLRGRCGGIRGFSLHPVPPWSGVRIYHD